MKIIKLSMVALLAAPLLAQGGYGTPKLRKADQKQAKKTKAKTKIAKLGSVVDANISLKDINGKVHKLADLRGKVVFIHFWSIKCPYEINAEPKISQISADYAKKDVVVLAINANRDELGKAPVAAASEEAVIKDADVGNGEVKKRAVKPYANLHRHVKKNKLNHSVLVDHGNKVADYFKARSTPHCFVIDKKGVLQYSGALDNNPRNNMGDEAVSYVRNALDSVLAGQPVEVNSTKPYG